MILDKACLYLIIHLPKNMPKIHLREGNKIKINFSIHTYTHRKRDMIDFFLFLIVYYMHMQKKNISKRALKHASSCMLCYICGVSLTNSKKSIIFLGFSCLIY